MLAVSGTYEHGQITIEKLPASKKKSKVIVTFLDEVDDTIKHNRKAGGLSGKVWMADDFNEPLDELKEYM